MFYELILNDLLNLEKEKSEFNCDLVKYNQSEIMNFVGGKVRIAYDTNDVQEFISSNKNKANNFKLYYGKVSYDLASKISLILGLDINNYNISLKSDTVKHILKKHSGAREFLRGQVPITLEDFNFLGEIISCYDSIEKANITSQGVQSIVFRKKLKYFYEVVVYLSKKSKSLEIKTMYKKY